MRQHVWASHVGIGAAVIFLLSACVSSAAPSRVPASPTTPVAATAANAADTIARQWLTAMQAKGLDAMAALWAPDGVWEDGATGETFTGGPQAERSGSAEALGMMIAAKGASVLALGDGVAVLAYTFHGPTPAHSSPIDVPMITVLHVKDARIIRETVYYNPKLAYGS
jgi:ketosteroid isomerase-like protein